MQTSLTNSNPLVAAGQWTSPWLQVDPLYPFVSVQAASDQAGSMAIFEADQNDGAGAPISAHQVGSVNISGSGIAGTLNPTSGMLQVQVRAAYYRVIYTNGVTAQQVFSLALQGSTVPVDSTLNRKFDLMLRELRAHTHLLLSLKEPGNMPPNLPMGFDVIQGDIIPPGVQASPSAPAPAPSFS